MSRKEARSHLPGDRPLLMARQDTNEPNRLIAASIGLARPATASRSLRAPARRDGEEGGYARLARRCWTTLASSRREKAGASRAGLPLEKTILKTATSCRAPRAPKARGARRRVGVFISRRAATRSLRATGRLHTRATRGAEWVWGCPCQLRVLLALVDPGTPPFVQLTVSTEARRGTPERPPPRCPRSTHGPRTAATPRDVP